jgi:hypothetical protein
MNNEDYRMLDLLSLFHYIVGGIMALFSCFPFIHLFIGLAFVSGNLFKDSKGGNPPELFGWFFVIIAAVAILLGWTLAVLMLVTGHKMKQRRHRMFCLVVAGIECMFMPFGTVLGIFTIVILNKESVQTIFLTAENGVESIRQDNRI